MNFFSRLQRIAHFSAIQPVLRDIHRTSYVAGLTAALLILGGTYVLWPESDSLSAAGDLAMVERGDIVTTVSALGSVTFANEQQLKFTQRGTVASVYVREGDSVTAGQLLAELDKTTVLADVQQAALSVSASALQLQELENTQEKQLLDAQNAVRAAERQFTQAQNAADVALQELPAQLQNAKRTVQERRAALEQAEAELQKTEANELRSLGITAQSILTDTEKLLDTLYSVLTKNGGVRPPDGSDLPIDVRLYRDLDRKWETERAYMETVNIIATMRARYGTSLALMQNPSELLSALTDASAAAQSVYRLAESVSVLLDGAVTDGTLFTNADLAALRSQVFGARSSATALVEKAQTAASNLTAVSANEGIPSVTLSAKRDALVNAEHALKQAEENLAVLQTKTPGDLEAKQFELAKIQEDFASKEAGLKNTDRSIAIQASLKKNDLAQRATSLQKIRRTVEDYQIKAPFSGIIRRLDFRPGDNLLADSAEEKFIILENRDFLVVTILLDQVDIVRIARGMTAHVVFDALPDRTFAGEISEINATPVQESGVVSYEVSVQLPMPEGLTILSGMTAAVTIDVAKKEHVLRVPNLALKRVNGEATVTLEDGRTVAVESGLTDGRWTEVLSGLSEGDRVKAINVRTDTTDANADEGRNSPQQFMRVGGGFPGGGTRTFSR